MPGVRQLSLMNMSELFLILLLTVGMGVLAPAQTRRQRAPLSARLSKQHPSVYISFVRAAKIASVRTGKIEETVWLRLHNNTRWSIWLHASGVPEEYGDAELYYAVEDAERDERLYGSTRCHACSIIPLHPGKSILFSLPREDVSADRRIRIEFSYDWEDRDDVTAGREVQHSVFFDGSELDKKDR